MNFAWDPRKEGINVEKHGIAFADACRIFEDVTIERIDDRFDYGEQRIVAIGLVDGVYMTVVYTLRGETRRIISARRATRHERRSWQDANSA